MSVAPTTLVSRACWTAQLAIVLCKLRPRLWPAYVIAVYVQPDSHIYSPASIFSASFYISIEVSVSYAYIIIIFIHHVAHTYTVSVICHAAVSSLLEVPRGQGQPRSVASDTAPGAPYKYKNRIARNYMKFRFVFSFNIVVNNSKVQCLQKILYSWSPSTRRHVIGQAVLGIWSKVDVTSSNQQAYNIVID